MPHPALSSGSVAVITGGASGIGLAAAMRLARMGLRVCIADLGEERLGKAAAAIAAEAPDGADSIMTAHVDVSVADGRPYNVFDPALNPDPETAQTMIGLLLRERCESEEATDEP